MLQTFLIQIRQAYQRVFDVGWIFAVIVLWTGFSASVVGLHMSSLFHAAPSYSLMVIASLYLVALWPRLEQPEFFRIATRANIVLTLVCSITGLIKILSHITEGVEKLAALQGAILVGLYLGACMHLALYFAKFLFEKRQSEGEVPQTNRGNLKKAGAIFWTAVGFTSLCGATFLGMFAVIMITEGAKNASQKYHESTELYKKEQAVQQLAEERTKKEIDDTIHQTCKNLNWKEQYDIQKRIEEEEYKKAGLEYKKEGR